MADAKTVDSAAIVARLKQLGYEATDTDTATFTYLIAYIEQELKIKTNLSSIPAELYYVEIDMICGEFLRDKLDTGQLTGYDFTSAVKTINEGDTSVTFADDESLSSKIGKLITWLCDHGMEEIIAFRRLKW